MLHSESLIASDVFLPVSHNERGQRQGYDKTNETQESSPNGEREQEYGRVQSHATTHYLRRNVHIYNDLHNGKHQYGESEDNPEVLTCVQRLQSGKHGCWNKGKSMEVRHKVHDANHYAQTYCHRESDDGKAYAEQYAHDEGNEALTTKIVVEGGSGIMAKVLPERAYALREYLHPIVGEVLIVIEDEEHVEQYDTRAHNAHHDIPRGANELEHLRHRRPQSARKIIAAKEFLYLTLVVVNPLRNGLRDARDVGGVVHIISGKGREFPELLNHRRDDSIDHSTQYENNRNHSDEDT